MYRLAVPTVFSAVVATIAGLPFAEAGVVTAAGDNQYGEDPSVNRLQEPVAELLGKEAAPLVPSGTMANQIGLKILTRPGDEVILGDEAHIVWHEAGAGPANSGMQFAVGGGGNAGTQRTCSLRSSRGCKPPRVVRAYSAALSRTVVSGISGSLDSDRFLIFSRRF